MDREQVLMAKLCIVTDICLHFLVKNLPTLDAYSIVDPIGDLYIMSNVLGYPFQWCLVRYFKF